MCASHQSQKQIARPPIYVDKITWCRSVGGHTCRKRGVACQHVISVPHTLTPLACSLSPPPRHCMPGLQVPTFVQWRGSMTIVWLIYSTAISQLSRRAPMWPNSLVRARSMPYVHKLTTQPFIIVMNSGSVSYRAIGRHSRSPESFISPQPRTCSYLCLPMGAFAFGSRMISSGLHQLNCPYQNQYVVAYKYAIPNLPNVILRRRTFISFLRSMTLISRVKEMYTLLAKITMTHEFMLIPHFPSNSRLNANA